MALENSESANARHVSAASAPVSFLYRDEAEALKLVQDRYHYWTEKLTGSSFDLSLAVIASNWAAFGAVDKILQNPWAKWSIAAVILSLGLSLLGTKLLGESLRRRIEYAESHTEQWEKEYQQSLGHSDPWPFTTDMDLLARILREAKTWLPFAGGVLFLIALAF